MNVPLSNVTTLGAQPLSCVTGVVNLRFFGGIPGIIGGDPIVATVTTFTGQVIPLIQTVPTPPGGTTLASVNGQVATVCGVLTTVRGQVVLDVRLVNPFFPIPTPFNINPLLLLLLLILSGRFGGTLAGINPTTVQNLLAQSGISPAQLQAVAQSITPAQMQALASQLGVQLPTI